MNAIVYMCQVSACMGIFYGFYYFMLSRLTFFTINRWYLVATLVLSFVIPLLTITIRPDSAPIVKEVAYVNQFQSLQAQEPLTFAPQPAIKPAVNWIDVLKTGYLLAVMVLFIRLIVMLAAFFGNIKSKKNTKIGNVHILHGDKKLNNGSFLNFIFLNDDELSPDEIQQIIEHEMLHVKLLHSVDRIVVKIAQIILWFNPFVYLYARAIEENHEFEVDREIGLSNDKSKYADMLLHLSVARQGMLYNSFSMVPLKKRITMLFTKPTNHIKKVIYLLALPVVMLSCLAFARLEDNSYDGKYSVISGIEKLGDGVVVQIDGKRYDKDILYKISATCIKKSVVSSSIITGGTVIQNPKVYIETVKGIIEYMTSAEKENLTKERSVPKNQFYTRLNLTGPFGVGFDKVIIQVTNGSITSTLPAGGKVGMFIDDVFYNESEIANVPAEKVKSIIAPYNSKSFKPGENVKGLLTIFYLNTKAANNDNKPAVKTKQTNQPLVQQKEPVAPFPISPITTDEKQKLTKLMDDVFKFYSRKRIYDSNKAPHDKITFKYAGGSASADLGVDDVAGAFIDGEFYDEAALKKITSEKATQLHVTHEGFNVKKIPDDKNYAVPFAFKTKTTQVIQQPGTSKPAAIPATPKMGMRVEKKPFFSRTPIEDSEGKHDKITFKLTDESVSTNIDPGMKTGAFIDGVFYDEAVLNTLPSSKIARLGLSHEILDRRKIPNGYKVPMSFKTKNSKGEVDDAISLKGMSQRGIDSLNQQKLAMEVLKRSHYPQFYSRIKFNAVDGKDHDYVVCTIGKGIVSVPVMLNAKTGLLIDGVFYDEEAVKKLPDSTGKKLELWREGFDPKKVPKDYIAAFTLRTKAEK